MNVWDIERLVVWAMRDQGLGWGGGDRAVEDISDYGTIIDDGGSHPNMGLWSDDDALLVKQAVDGLPGEARTLVTLYCRAGIRPEWAEEGEGRWQQLTDGRGRLRWLWSDMANRTGEKRALMGFVGLDPEIVEFERAQYSLWWQGLADIVGPLNRRMKTHHATGPEAHATPWSLPKVKVHGLSGEAADEVRRPILADRAYEMRAAAQAPVLQRPADWTGSDDDMHRDDSQARTALHGGR